MRKKLSILGKRKKRKIKIEVTLRLSTHIINNIKKKLKVIAKNIRRGGLIRRTFENKFLKPC